MCCSGAARGGIGDEECVCVWETQKKNNNNKVSGQNKFSYSLFVSSFRFYKLDFTNW